MKNENLFERGNHNQEPPTNTSKGAANHALYDLGVSYQARLECVRHLESL
jgi:hypothetical protein